MRVWHYVLIRNLVATAKRRGDVWRASLVGLFIDHNPLDAIKTSLESPIRRTATVCTRAVSYKSVCIDHSAFQIAINEVELQTLSTCVCFQVTIPECVWVEIECT